MRRPAGRPGKYQALLIFLALAVPAAHAAPAEVIVLSTLHQLHGQTNGYSFDDLAEIIVRLAPDVLAVELTAGDLESRREQPTKMEYQRAVFPLLDEHGYELVPLEPPQPMYDDLVGRLRKAGRELEEQRPEAAATFGLYVESLYAILERRWTSAVAVNSPETDLAFAVKHRFQSAVFGAGEAAAWEGWNRHFLAQVMAAAEAHPGRRILVLVGAEHAYWLRRELASQDVVLPNTAVLLEQAGLGAARDAGRPGPPAPN